MLNRADLPAQEYEYGDVEHSGSGYRAPSVELPPSCHAAPPMPPYNELCCTLKPHTAD